jgi:hypothetical protein
MSGKRQVMSPRIDLAPTGALYRPRRYPDVKDPSPAFDGTLWHLFGTGCGVPGGVQVLHSTAPALDGRWTEQEPCRLFGVDHVQFPSAPGVTFEDGRFHLFLQQDFNILGGVIEHLVSDDGGNTFVRTDTSLESVARTSEAGIYDPDPGIVNGVKYLTYSAMSVVGQPDIYLARSTTGSWDGPWARLGRILSQEDVDIHNQIGDDDYEWGLEGPQLSAMPDGTVLLTAVCFLKGRPRGQRQRLLLAAAPDPLGPYEILGPLVEPETGGENGHGSAVVHEGALHVVYQERAGEGRPWHYRHAVASLDHVTADLADAVEEVIELEEELAEAG